MASIMARGGTVQSVYECLETVEKVGEATTNNDIVSVLVQPTVAYSVGGTAQSQINSPSPRVLNIEGLTAPLRFVFSRGPNTSALSTITGTVSAIGDGIYRAVLANPGTQAFPAVGVGQTIEVRDVSAGNAVIWTAVVLKNEYAGDVYSTTIFRALAAPSTTVETGDTVFNRVPSIGTGANTGFYLGVGVNIRATAPYWATHILAIRATSTDGTIVVHAVTGEGNG